MRVLLTNDDGVDAPGLAILADVVSEFAEPVIVAPAEEMSECGHRITTHRDLRLSRLGGNRYALDGLPADCVRIGLSQVCPDVDWVLSGVNDGGNLGVDVFRSGTVAAAREAAIMGRPAIALSQYRRGEIPRDWRDLAVPLRRVLQEYLGRPSRPGQFWNLNFPAMQDLTAATAVVECPLDHSPLPVEYDVDGDRYRYRGRYSDRARAAGHDVDLCFSGNITATQISLFGGRG